MTIFPKRVWTKKGMVFHDKKPVRKLGDKLWVYDPNFTEVDSWKVYPEKAWENVPATEELLIYDWEQPTYIGTFEDWLLPQIEFACRDADTKELWWWVVTMNGEDTTTTLTFTAKSWDTMSYDSENKTFTIVGDFTNVIGTNPDQYRFVYGVEVNWEPIDFTSITITENMTIDFLFAQH